MKQLEYSVHFNTPAFLGNAEQSAQWRTPPFKALLRQWWRVVKAKDFGYDHHRLREAEMCLFGTAADGGDGGSHRSLVRLRLNSWEMGTLKNRDDVPSGGQVCHPNVKNDKMPACPDGKPGRMVGSNLYLGFGPVGVGGLVRPPAIAPTQEMARLRIACAGGISDSILGALRDAMQLAAWFGTLGSRSRNGWGAVHFDGEGLSGLDGLYDSALERIAPLCGLDEAMQREWPHAIGRGDDGRPAVWHVYAHKEPVGDGKTRFVGFDSWHGVMKKLAEIKIKFRTQFDFQGGEPHNELGPRHVLAYPVTHHGLKGIKGKTMDGRLANQLHFKVVANGKGELFGVIVHLPCGIPKAFFKETTARMPDLRFQADAWRRVHDCIDAQFPQSIVRIRKG